MDPIRCIGWQLITTMYMANYDTTTALETPHWYSVLPCYWTLGARQYGVPVGPYCYLIILTEYCWY